MPDSLWIALGGALGSVSRYWFSEYSASYWRVWFPGHDFAAQAGILVVNIIGSLAIGLIAGLMAAEMRLVPQQARLFLMVGFCGGFTTFSSFSLHNMELLQRGEWLYAVLNMTFSVLLCVVGVAAGFAAGRALVGG